MTTATVQLNIDHDLISNEWNSRTKASNIVFYTDAIDYIVKNNDLGITDITYFDYVVTYIPSERMMYLILSDKLNAHMAELILDACEAIQ